jgi:hypothetical protein
MAEIRLEHSEAEGAAVSIHLPMPTDLGAQTMLALARLGFTTVKCVVNTASGDVSRGAEQWQPIIESYRSAAP